MISKRRTRVKRYSFKRIVVVFLFGFLLSLIVYTHLSSRTAECKPAHPHEIISSRDAWQYQSSLTGKWYNWLIPYRKVDDEKEWRLKWWNTNPTSSLGVIVYLTTTHELQSLRISLRQLARLLVNPPRPIVIFHEGDFNDTSTQQSLARTLGPRTPLAFERIKFSDSSKATWAVHHGSSSKYLDMCRFFTLMLLHHPLLTLFSFYWRLDSHSYIFGPNPIQDPFLLMQEKQIHYAFIMATMDDENYTANLWSFFHRFLSNYCLEPSPTVRQTQTSLFGGYSSTLIFTNFVIANVSLLRDHPWIRIWLQKVDQSGEIYRRRWGDAPLHTLALTQFIDREKVARLRYFGYFHRREYICASGVEENACKQQVKSFTTAADIEYVYYEDGCHPTTANSLCHYYPEIAIG